MDLPKPPLESKQITENLYSYVIIDCAHFDEEFYQRIIQNPTLTAESLFMRTLDEESAVAGPLLIKLDLEKNKDFIEKIQQIEQQKPAIIWLWSEIDFIRLADNTLKPLLYGTLEDTTEVLIRYYDPRCIKGMLETLKENEMTAKKLTNIKAWAFKHKDDYHYLV